MRTENLTSIEPGLAPVSACPSARRVGREAPAVCLLGATFGTNNMGVNALTVGAVKAILYRWPEARVFILDYARAPHTYSVPVGGGRVEVPVVNMRFSKKVWLRNHVLVLIGLAVLCRLIPLRAFRNRVLRGNSWLKAINEAGFAASVAGGDSFSDLYGLKAFFYVTLPQLLCLIWGKPLLTLPQTYGPFRGRIARSVARVILRRAAMICSRDYRGVPYAAKLAGSGRAVARPRFCPDLGLLLDPDPPPNPGIVGLGPRMPGSCLIGLNVSGLLSKAGGKYGVRAHFRTDYDSLVFRLIDFLIRSKNASVLLIPHVFGTAQDSDSVVCARIYDQLRSKYPRALGFAAGTYDQSQVKHIIGSCDLVIGSRMHACIAAISQAVPAVSLAYSDKFVGVMETLGLTRLVGDLRILTEKEILELASIAVERIDGYRAWLEVEMPKAKESVLDLFAGLGNPDSEPRA
jgi:polysaccharide pyruvyl transferase WcaK-like protein